MRYWEKKITVFDIVLVLFMIVFMCICLYPLLYVLSMSISDPLAVARQEVWLYPKGFSTEAYQILFKYPYLLISYGNTIWYTVVGTAISVLLTLLLAYPLSRRQFFLRNYIMTMIMVTMFIGGGLIPKFMLVSKLGLYNTRWAIVIPSAIGTTYVIIARTFFTTIPESLFESAKLDGAGDWVILAKIIMPLSKPLISVLVLYYAVGQWNQYFHALIYLLDENLKPLQLFLRRILIENTREVGGELISGVKSWASEQIKSCAIIVSVIPILCVYPYLQKYFVKGVMIGSLKG